MGYNFSSKEQASFNSMAAVTICSDFGAQKIKYIFLVFVNLKFENVHGLIVLIALTQGHLKIEFLVKLKVFFFFLKHTSKFSYDGLIITFKN